ncbi:MAG: YqaJ viral recombinase family protein [Methylicorpusculum sp.]|uniref:YqaJ viral recombinase family nuclease n=1 Tax=Methylicorpusculum sp. TaxID=2713644 RepID=UPI0027206B1A|nr:YqaJ viral recombinase family protein [Methylicorpusculum sp.]MDO8941060.1 YqaJ viral recombinase family protein [Methylicorpusculum sp.]MDP2202341.1 YqaJ viral recombinase family protein [Methylicorpusculum sp.]
MNIVDLAQRTPPWHQWRNTGVSASEAIVVLGKCPLKTVYRLYTDKKGLTLPDNLDANPFVQRGLRLEATARRSFERRHDILLLPVCAEADAYPFLRASFDGLNDEGIPVELKVPMAVNFYDAQQHGVHSKIYQRYYFQVQQQIAVADTECGYLSLYLDAHVPPLDFLIQRDERVIQELIAKARTFVEGLTTQQAPPVDPQRDIYIPSGRDHGEWAALAAQYHQLEEMIQSLKAQLAPLAQEQTLLEKKFIALMGDFVQAESAGLRISRYLAQGCVDYKAALTAIQPGLDWTALEAFRKASAERSRITLKTEDKAHVPFSMTDLMACQERDMWF